MQKKSNRKDRVAEMIQRKLAQIILQEVKDPRLPGFITISAIKVTSDLAHAKVYFTALSDEHRQAETILNSAASFLRTALARTMDLRTVPQLHFVYDESIEYGTRLRKLIDDVTPHEPDITDDNA